MSGENSIPNGWMETTLGDVIKLVGGGTPKTSINEYWNGSIPWLSVVDFNDDNRWVSNAEKSITELGLKKSSTKLLNIGDIIISARGTVGAMAQLKKEMAFNQSCYGIKEIENVSDKDFLFYLVKYSLKQINRNSYGAVFDTITTKTFDVININLPPLPEQVAIAKILTAFDDKIELLQAQNKTLETTAQTLFKEWFGKYQIGDALPDGWRVGKLEELGIIICGKTPSKSNKKYYGNDIPFIKIPDMHNQMFITNTIDNLSLLGANSQKNKIIPANSICVSCIATVGLVSLTIKDSQTNQQINSIIPQDAYSREFIYLKLLEMTKYLNDLGSGGTATLNVNTSTFSNIEVIIPKEDKLKEFHNIVSPIFEKILSNLIQIQTLKQTRDTLLPKLMSGQLRVDAFKEGSLC